MAYLTLTLFEQIDTKKLATSVTEKLLKNVEVLCGHDFEKAIDVSNLLRSGSVKEREKRAKIEHKCKICSKTFTDAFKLERHKQRGVHGVFVCDLCSKGFTKRFCLKRHKLSVHSQERYTCDRCGRTFNQKSSIETHLLRHIGEYRFNCFHCTKKFATKVYLKAHIKNMHSLTPAQIREKYRHKYFCSYCNKGFTQKPNALIHEMRKHEPHKLRHRCFCGLAYATANGYEVHLKTHLPIEYRRKYICPECGKALLSKENLEKHEETHKDNRKRVKCTLCCSDFANKLLMKRHMREVHLKIKRKIPVCTVV